MSTSVKGIRDLDGMFSRMILVRKYCDEAEVGYPEKLVEYFGGHGLKESEEYLREQMETIDIDGALIEFSRDSSDHVEVDLSKLPEEVKAIRFTNSW